MGYFARKAGNESLHRQIVQSISDSVFSKICKKLACEKRRRDETRNILDVKLKKTLLVSMQIAEARRGFVALRNPQGQFVCCEQCGFSADESTPRIDSDALEYISHVCFGSFPPNTPTHIALKRSFFTPSAACIPLASVHSTIGILYLDKFDKQRCFQDDEISIIEILNRMTADAFEKARISTDCVSKRDRIKKMAKKEGIIVESDIMIQLYHDVMTFAAIDIPVFITGEAGSGKELVAKGLHLFSPRKGAFVALNCSAIPEGIFESELFGSVKGAFHNAGDKPGKLEMAHNGTFFLDEIGDMGLLLQPKLLRFIENKKNTRLGDTKSRTIEARVVAATNRDIESMIGRREFRNDLYQRLSCIQLHVPPLRERKEEIPVFVDFFLEECKQKHSLKTPKLLPSALEALCEHEWLGNVRELKNTILRLVVRHRGTSISKSAVRKEIQQSIGNKPPPQTTGMMSIRNMEKQLITEVLLKTGYNISKASKILQIARSTLHDKMKRYKIRMTEQQH